MRKEAKELLFQMAIQGGTWPAHSFEQSAAGKELMRLGLAELIQPENPYLPYAELTAAGANVYGAMVGRGFRPGEPETEQAGQPIAPPYCKHPKE